ncbi:MAG: glucosyl-3-phosphoglycerate synthase [Chthoniobacter sp.]|jgi:glucosyl-3-phosphoglycerate synthase|nr:glucosyl-3-phosphoglycerate synthase [Chthoniobacter sp.]
MSDFAQSGLICTLQRLNDTHPGRVEEELLELSRTKPIALVLPCHGADLERPALAGIVEQLAGAAFLREIVISLNGVDAADFAAAPARFAVLPQTLTFLWNERPGAAQGLTGKGGNVAAAFEHVSAAADSEIVVTQDCDVASFRRGDLARLCYAIAHPQLGYRFAKMYYSRVTDRLYGRVSRLFVAPLLHAVRRVAGHLPLLDFLLSFRYPLAGEVALTRELAATLPVSAGWGLEIGQLCELFRRVDPREVCQVGGGADYDHKHQPAATALASMAAEIARELFTQLATEGLSPDAAFRAAIAQAYRREAAFALRTSAGLALINGLPFDALAERAIVENFAALLDVPVETAP